MSILNAADAVGHLEETGIDFKTELRELVADTPALDEQAMLLGNASDASYTSARKLLREMYEGIERFRNTGRQTPAIADGYGRRDRTALG